VKVIGLGKDQKTIAPLLLVLRPGTLSDAGSLSVPQPVVFEPKRREVQDMVVIGATRLFTTPDGRSLWLLRAYCLDKDKDAPLVGDVLAFRAEAQAQLSPAVLSILSSGEDVQNRIWQAQ
jgi:hypothetical protein